MISRLAGAVSVLLVLLSVAYALGLARSPDSDLVVGVIAALPLLGIAAALGLVAWWTRKGPPGGD